MEKTTFVDFDIFNGVIAKIAVNDLYQIFEGKKFEILYLWNG